MEDNTFTNIVEEYLSLNLGKNIDYDKFYLYSIITHSTAIEGSSMTVVDNQILFDDGLTIKGKTMIEQEMNLDLRDAYRRSQELASEHAPITLGLLKHLSSFVMRRTGSLHNGWGGQYDSARGDLRKDNVTAGPDGRLYMDWRKVPERLKTFCKEINEQRMFLLSGGNIIDKYNLSFDAHLKLVDIHPWVDGNGRMSRLLMNHLQYEFGIPMTKIEKKDREDYIKALNDSRENDDVRPFRDFMMDEHGRNLEEEIDKYKEASRQKPRPRLHL